MPVRPVQYAWPGRFRALVQCEDVGISHRPVASARHRSGDHPAVVAVSGEHEEVVEQSELEEACVAVAVAPGERPGAQLVRAARHVPGRIRGNDGRTRRTWIHHSCFGVITRADRDPCLPGPSYGFPLLADRALHSKAHGQLLGTVDTLDASRIAVEPAPHGSHGYSPLLLSHAAVSARRQIVTALTSSSV